MDEKNLSRRQLLGAVAVTAGTAGVLGTAGAQDARPATGPQFPDLGQSQRPTITTVRDKVVYITGGSSGIGLGIARAMHAAGAKVVIGNLDDKQWADALQNFPADDARLMTVVHNVMDKDGWQRTADAIEKKFGPVHILVNNAGVGLQQSASAGSLNDWEWGMGVNFWGPVYGINAFVPRMLAHGQGAQIVTTTSTSGIVPNNGAGIYSVSKMAAVALMEELRGELRATTIGTTCFVPGNTTSNLGQSESYRPEALRNEAPATAAAPRAGGPPRPAAAAR
ncbi:MAG TPA: SDR family NAD(P)-dependent oxidoreductase, partial [Steroidobacteraceae bacterium]|nr:SDR family NAD(P)-dependent oxidoreductase [Steroidobacteraceae bacterium]